MDDPLDQFLTGVPNAPANTPQIFGSNAVSPTSARRIVNNRVANEGYLLGTRDKLNALRDREVSRTQGQAALGMLTQLDPINDPEYLNKVSGIISQNPQATLDATVNNFLGIQGKAFGVADDDRRRQTEIDRQGLLEVERDRRVTELGEQRNRSELELRRDAALQGEVDNLPPTFLTQFNEYRNFGLPPHEAMSKVKEDAASAGAISELADLGIDPDSDEVLGLSDGKGGWVVEGIFDKSGKIDKNKVFKLKAKAKAEEVGRKTRSYEQKDANDQLIRLQKRYEFRDMSGDDFPEEEKQQLKDAMAHFSNLASPTLPNTGKSGIVSDPSTPPVKVLPDRDAGDRYIPK